MAKKTTKLNVSDDTPVEFEHADGQRYGGTYKAFTELYEPAGYKLVARGDGQPLNVEDAPEVNEPPTQPMPEE